MHVDGEEVWLVLLPTQQQDRYRVLLLRSDVDFEVSAGTDEECLDEIVRELRRRDRRVP